jgi:hypothetical protein
MKKLYWGETHHNTFQHADSQRSLTDILNSASEYLDFYSGAYYTSEMTRLPLNRAPADPAGQKLLGHPAEMLESRSSELQGVFFEKVKERAQIEREWAEVESATKENHIPNKFVTFPGYEWQGDGRWGDHNVIFKSEGENVYTPNTLPELYANLRKSDALAIPHHTAYVPGKRAPIWRTCDSTISPFAEIFSIHGCSESDEEWIGLRQNSHMGPGVGGSTYEDALRLGLHIGAIASTDNWGDMPGSWGDGLMGCWAGDLTRDSLWSAFKSRRVYGVTGDRIRLWFTANDAPMGSILENAISRRLSIEVVGCDAIDRIEVLRNNQVIDTYNHQGTWAIPAGTGKSKYKLRIEAGWGPRSGEIPIAEKTWNCVLSLKNGKITGWEPCWIAPGHTPPEVAVNSAKFRLISNQANVGKRWQGGMLFEIEGNATDTITLAVNGQSITESIEEFANRSRVLSFEDESGQILSEATSVGASGFPRDDTVFLYAFKVKIHKCIPAAGYSASFSLTDTEKFRKGIHYRVRVLQRNGQSAWSSPIWFNPVST